MDSKSPITISKRTVTALVFLLSMSMLGLEVPLSYLFLFAILAYSYATDRYAFLVQLLLFSGGFGFYDTNIAFPIKIQDFILAVSILGIPFLFNRKLQRKLIISILVYIFILICFALISNESFSIQLRKMREYSSILFFVIPFLVFRNRHFSIHRFSRIILIYATIILTFYSIDSLVLCSQILVPRTFGGENLWNSFQINPFSDFIRKYPSGAIFALLAMYPISSKLVHIRMPNALYFSIGILVTKTMSFIAAILVIFFMFQKRIGQKIIIMFALCVGFSTLYYIDLSIGGELRIVQFLDQMTNLKSAKNYSDLAEFGTGRGSQAISKIQNLNQKGRLMVGFGFIHEKLSKSKEYEVMNTYSNQGHVVEQSGSIEVAQLQTIMDIGIIGLIIQHLFFIYLYLLIKNCKHKKYYLSVLIGLSLTGIGGFYGLNSYLSLSMLGLALASVVLDYNSTSRINKIAKIIK